MGDTKSSVRSVKHSACDQSERLEICRDDAALIHDWCAEVTKLKSLKDKTEIFSYRSE